MPTVKVLHDAVGPYNAGDIVPEAPAGLVEMAEKETRNAATGLLLVEFVDDVSDEFESLKAKAKDLKIRGYANMKFETLKTAVEAAEADQAAKGPDSDATDPASSGPDVTDPATQEAVNATNGEPNSNQ